MPAYSISPLSCNDLHLQSGRVVDPIVIEDVSSSMIDEGMNPWFENSFSSAIPIIEDVETLAKKPIKIHDETPAERLAETHTKTQPTQSLREPPYARLLTLQKAVEQPSFKFLGEMKKLYVRISLLQALHDVPIYAKTIRDLVVKKLGRKHKYPLQCMWWGSYLN